MGNFHRAHQALYTQDASGQPWDIIGVTRSNARMVGSLQAQDHGYSVITVDGDSAHARWVDVHRASLVAREEPEAVVNLLAHPQTRVVTLTVTEGGHTFRAADLTLDLEHPEVRSDLTGRAAPMTTVGQLAAGLTARAGSHGERISLVDRVCDLVTTIVGGGISAALDGLSHSAGHKETR
jgi:fructuronate reductase